MRASEIRSMSRTPLPDERLGNGQHPPLGKARAPLRTGVAEHQHVLGRHVERLVVHGGLHLGVAVEHERRPLVDVEARVAGGGLDASAPEGARLPRSTASEPSCVDGVRERPDHVLVPDAWRLRQVLAQGPARHRERGGVEPLLQPLHQRQQAAGVEEVLHQVVLARRPHVGEERRDAAQRVEVVEGEIHVRPARHGDQVDHGVGGAARGHGDDRGCCARRPASRSGPASGPPTPSPRRAARRPRTCAGGPSRARGSRRRRAASGPWRRRPPSWWRRCPWSCRRPTERAMPPWMPRHSSSVTLPARRSSQYFQPSEPEPRTRPA